jgi:hypothetical protein
MKRFQRTQAPRDEMTDGNVVLQRIAHNLEMAERSLRNGHPICASIYRELASAEVDLFNRIRR